MKTIALALALALALTAWGCSKKAGNDCEVALGKAVDAAAEAAKTHQKDPRIQESIAVLAKIRKTVFTKRCIEDKWPEEVVACFGKATGTKDATDCENKLTEEQKNKIRTDVRTAIMAERGGMPNIPGHPQMLRGSGGSAAEPGAAAPPAGAPGEPPAGAPPATPPAAPATPPAPAAGSEPPSAAGTPPAGSGK